MSIRVNPRQRDQGFITAAGVKRIARMRELSGEELARQAAVTTAAKKQRVIENPDSWLMVCLHAKAGQLDNHDAEMLYIAQALAQDHKNRAVIAVLFGECQDDLAELGADKVVQVDYDLMRHYQPELQVDALCQLINDYAPEHVLFAESEWGDSDLARRVSVAGDWELATDVIEISSEHVLRLVDNGRQAASRDLPKLIALRSQVSRGELEFSCAANASELAVSDDVSPADVFRMGAEDIPLTEAPLILSAGNGVADMALFERCAQRLDAAIGGSRVVVDDGKLPRERQVGATGQTVKATVYIALGISGAVQHLQGIKDCKNVIAVNTDEAASMIKRADLSLIHDAVEVMGALIEAVEAEAQA